MLIISLTDTPRGELRGILLKEYCSYILNECVLHYTLRIVIMHSYIDSPIIHILTFSSKYQWILSTVLLRATFTVGDFDTGDCDAVLGADIHTIPDIYTRGMPLTLPAIRPYYSHCFASARRTTAQAPLHHHSQFAFRQ